MFAGLAFSVCRGIEFGLIAYTGERYTKVLDGADRIGLLSSDAWSTLSDEFFERLAAKLVGVSQPLVAYEPRPHQRRAIENAKKHFVEHGSTRGKLIMPCGTGKSLTAFWIAEALGAKTIVVAVPSLSLIQQTLPIWLREYAARGKHATLRWLCICSDQTVTKQDPDSMVIHTQDLGYPCLTNKDEIRAWLEETENASPRVIFVTYQSGKVLAEAEREAGVTIDLGVMDEAHKTVGQREKLFSHLLFDENLPMKQRVFMTATERRFAGQGDEIISMNDPEIYGETFELLTFKNALEQKPSILSDYKIITMVISHEEVAKLIAENRYVQPSGKLWNEEIEAQMLASMIVLRRAMEEHPIKHAVSFHSSIARAKAFREFNDLYTASHPDIGELETFHVTGATPASQRKRIIREFASAPRSLITNARCLTEGVDVPSIDCVLFADPKQSKVDIVQAAGRALRQSEGKRCGYVLVPIISHGEKIEEFIESSAFAAVLNVLGALGAHDERIIDEFRAVHNGQIGIGKIVEIEIDKKIAAKINLQDFAQTIEIRVWDRLARLSWRPYGEAIKFVHSLKLKGYNAWKVYCRGGRPDLPPKPPDIPRTPSHVYPEFKIKGGCGAWLGTNYRKGLIYRSYNDATEFVHSLKLKSWNEWGIYCKGERSDLPEKPIDIPTSADKIYGLEFKEKGGWGAWLGTGTKHNITWVRYDDAIKFVHALKLSSWNEWGAYCRGKRSDLPKKPIDIPASANTVYGSEFKEKGGWGAWLGTGRIADHLKVFKSYDEAVIFSQTLGLKGEVYWRKYCKGEYVNLPIKPSDIPASPKDVYGTEFKEKGGWYNWLGKNVKSKKTLMKQHSKHS